MYYILMDYDTSEPSILCDETKKIVTFDIYSKAKITADNLEYDGICKSYMIVTDVIDG